MLPTPPAQTVFASEHWDCCQHVCGAGADACSHERVLNAETQDGGRVGPLSDGDHGLVEHTLFWKLWLYCSTAGLNALAR